MIQKAKVTRPSKVMVYNFGVLDPHNVKQAYEPDKSNENMSRQGAFMVSKK
jgi:hypothetical protein